MNDLQEDGPALAPAVMDLVPRREAEELIRATGEQLTALEEELAEARDEAEAAERTARENGVDPTTLADADKRLSTLKEQLRADAYAYASHITAAAARAARTILAGAAIAPDQVSALDPVAPVPAPTLPVANPVRPMVAAPPPPPVVIAPAPAPPLPVAMVVPEPAPPVPMVVPEPAPPVPTVVPEPDRAVAVPVAEAPPTADDRRPYARTVGMLQVVLWSIVIAAVLILGLAWFA